MPETINCAEACANGCILGDQCPHLPYQQETAAFLEKTSFDDILAIAAARIERLRAAHRPPEQPE